MKSVLSAALAITVALGAIGLVEAAQPPGKPAPPAGAHRPAPHPHPQPTAPRVATQNIVVYPSNWLNNTYPRVYPSYYNPYYYSPYDSYGDYGYGGYSPYYYSPYYYAPAPIFVPAGTLYGPGPILNMMGVGNWSGGAGGGSAPRAAVERPAPRVAAKPANPPRGKPDAEDAAASAQRYIAVGDTSFAKQKFSDANDRYRRAVRTAPQLADAWFRQGFALAGMGHYETAATSLRRGLELKPDWPKSDFRLAALFGGDEAAKTAFLEGLAAAAEAQPRNVDLLFLLGVCQHFDGQPQRAATFLKRANELAPGEKAHLQAFLE